MSTTARAASPRLTYNPSALAFESALDHALMAQGIDERLAALQADYRPKREAFDRYLFGNGPRVESPEFYTFDHTLLHYAKQQHEQLADQSWEWFRDETEAERVL